MHLVRASVGPQPLFASPLQLFTVLLLVGRPKGTREDVHALVEKKGNGRAMRFLRTRADGCDFWSRLPGQRPANTCMPRGQVAHSTWSRFIPRSPWAEEVWWVSDDDLEVTTTRQMGRSIIVWPCSCVGTAECTALQVFGHIALQPFQTPNPPPPPPTPCSYSTKEALGALAKPQTTRPPHTHIRRLLLREKMKL